MRIVAGMLPSLQSGGGFAATANTVLTTKSAGMMSSSASGSPEKSRRMLRPKARISGSAILNPSSQPPNGSASALSMIDGRTMDSGISPCSSTTACSAIALVNE